MNKIQEIKDRIAADYINEFRKVTGKETKLPKVLEIFITALSYIFFSIYKKTESVVTNAIPSKITDVDVLRRFLHLNGLTIKRGAKAKGTIAIETNQVVTIADKTQLTDDVTGYIYETTTSLQVSSAVFDGAGKKIPNKFINLVNVEAEKIGAEYNRENPELSLVLTNNAVERIHIVEKLQNGLDEEDFFTAKERLLDYYRSPKTGGTKSDYLRWVKSVEGIEDAAIFSHVPLQGHIKILPHLVRNAIIEKNENQNYEIINFLPSDDQITAVEDHLKENAPLGVTYHVNKPTSRRIMLTIKNLETSGSLKDTKSKIIEAIKTFFYRNIKVGMYLVASEISAAISAVNGEEGHQLEMLIQKPDYLETSHLETRPAYLDEVQYDDDANFKELERFQLPEVIVYFERMIP